MEISSPVTSRWAGVRCAGRGGGECTVVAAPPALLPLVRGTPSERRPGGSIGLGSALLATATWLRIVALHSSSFPVVGGKSRSNCARARASAGVGGSGTCTDRDALRLLTMSEGALSRPRGRMRFHQRFGERAGLLRPGSGARGSSRGDARDLRRDYDVCRAPPVRSAPSAPAWESWKPSRRPRAGWQRSWKAPRHPRRAWLRLWIGG